MKPWFQKVVGVTGGSGAIGRRLVRQLKASGARRVVVLSRKAGGSAELSDASEVVHGVAGDILALRDLERAFQGCEIVFHLAALTDAGRSTLEPERYWEVNVLGTARVLEACRRVGVKHVVYASTGHVYGIPQRLPVSEDHPTAPLSIYAASKLAGEAVLQGYATAFDLGTTVARLTNVYGGSLGPETVIGRAISQTATGGPISLKNLAAVRDFIYLDDAVEALLRLGTLPFEVPKCRIVNVSCGKGILIRELAEALAVVAKSMGFGNIEISPPHELTEEPIPVLVLDNQRLNNLTSWVPSTELSKGLMLALQDSLA